MVSLANLNPNHHHSNGQHFKQRIRWGLSSPLPYETVKWLKNTKETVLFPTQTIHNFMSMQHLKANAMEEVPTGHIMYVKSK